MHSSFRIRLLPFALVATLAGLQSAMAQSATDTAYDRIPDNAYAVVAEVHAKSGKEQALREATLPLVARVRAEPNNLLYFLHEDREAPGHFIFYEVFVSQSDFEAHNATPHVQAWFARLPELADGDVKVTHMKMLNNAAAPR